MQRLVILGILLCTLSSAHRPPPAKLLGQEQMVSILADLEVARAIAWYYTADEDIACGLFQKNALLIYQAYDTDLDTFQKSYRYYLTHLELMKEIYEVVVRRLEELQGQM